MTTTSATDKQHLEFKAIDELNEFLGQNETIQMYLEDKLEEFGFDFDPDGAMTPADENLWASAQTIVYTKLLAKLIETM